MDTQPQANSSEAEPSAFSDSPGTLAVDIGGNVSFQDQKENSPSPSVEQELISPLSNHPPNDNPKLPVADTLANATSEAEAVVKDQIASMNTALPSDREKVRTELDDGTPLPVDGSEDQKNLQVQNSQELALTDKLSEPGAESSESTQQTSAFSQHSQTNEEQPHQNLLSSSQLAPIKSHLSSKTGDTSQSTLTPLSSEIQPSAYSKCNEPPQFSGATSNPEHALSQEVPTPKIEGPTPNISEPSSHLATQSESQENQELTPNQINDSQQTGQLSKSPEENKQSAQFDGETEELERLSTEEPTTPTIAIAEKNNGLHSTSTDGEITRQGTVPSDSTSLSFNPLDSKSMEINQPVQTQLNDVTTKGNVTTDDEASSFSEELTHSKKRNMASSEEDSDVETDQESSRLSKRQKVASDDEKSKITAQNEANTSSAMQVDNLNPTSQSPLVVGPSGSDDTSIRESTSAPIRSLPIRSNGLPLLRSSPVVPQGSVRSGRPVVTEPKDSSSSNSETTVRRDKKKKSVSWAIQDKLVEIHPIDTRIELVKSWDPDSQITLPFAPATLEMLQAVAKSLEEGGSEQSNTETLVNSNSEKINITEDGNNAGSIPMISSFEEARKKERDMELERARQARDELKSRLNGMSAKRKWSSPRSVVLPAECEIEDKNMEKFSIVDADYESLHHRSDDMQSPRSPPADWGWMDEGEVSDVQVHMFPLSEETGGDGDGGSHNDGSRWTENVERDFERRDNYFSGVAHGSSTGALGLRSMAPPTFVGRENEGRSGLRTLESLRNVSGGNNSGRSGGSRIDKRRSSLPDNVRQLLSALQTSGVLKGTKLGDIGRSQSAEHMNGGGNVSGTGGADGQEGYECRDIVNAEEDGFVGTDEGGVNGQGHTGEVNGSGASEGNGSGRMIGGGPNTGMGGPFGPGIGQASLMDCMPFGMPPVPSVPTVPPGALGLGPNLLPMGMGLPLGPLGMSMMPMAMSGGGMGMNGPGMGSNSGGEGGGSAVGDDGNGSGGNGRGSGRGGSRGGRGRHVETITRPKSKPSKNRKKCKYFGTKQGCRDGNACMFAHN